MMTKPGYTDITLYQRLLRQAQPYWPQIAGIFFLSLLATPLTLLTPVPLKIAVDSVLGLDPLPDFLASVVPLSVQQSAAALLALAAALVIIITLLSQLQIFGTSLLRTYTGEKILLNFRAQLFNHAQRLSLSYHDLTGTADSTYRIQYDTEAVRYVAIDGVIPFIAATITLISMFYVIFLIDWQLALVALVVSPILFLLARLYRRDLRQQARQVKKVESAALGVIQEVLTALRVVKAFGQEDREQERFVRRSGEGMRARIHLSLTENGLGFALAMTTAVGTAAVLYIGVRNVQAGILTLGDLLLVMSYLAQLYSPLKTISRKVASLQSHLASAERAFALLDEAPDVFDKPLARPITRAKGTVTLRHVSFSYNGNQNVLDDISIDVPAGTRVGIAGETGAGKTTLTNLLTRFYDPTAGQILLDGRDLRDYRLRDLRNQFSIVLQDTVLFATSIGENIAYASPNAGQAEIVAAAKAANIHKFVTSLPDGYDTLVGERGMRLSGGERQRVALARAFLKNAPVLIMDEPTSSVDVKTEAEIMDAMERLMRGRTTFMIAHRLSTLENCNLLLVLHQGKLVGATSDVAAGVKRRLDFERPEAIVHGERADG